MSFMKRFTEKFNDLIFAETEATLEEVAISAEQLASCEVEGDIVQTAENLINEAVKELDQAGEDNTIQAVQKLMDTWGGDCDADTVMKLLKVAKTDSEILKKDGVARIEKINGVMTLVANGMKDTLDQTTERAKEISEAMSKEEAAYTADVDALNKKCEENIRILREQLQADIEARGKDRDSNLENLKHQKAENDEDREEAEALNREVVKLGGTLISKIENWLSKLNVE